MSLHAPNDHSGLEYSNNNNKTPSHLLFQQRCRSRYSRAPPSSSTLSKLPPPFYTSTASSDSLSSLLKLMNHHYRLQNVDGQLAFHSSRPRRPILATSTSRCRLKPSHSSASARLSSNQLVAVDIGDMSLSSKKTSLRQPAVESHIYTHRRPSQASSHASSSSSEILSSPVFSTESVLGMPEKFSPRPTTAEQTATARSTTTSPALPIAKSSAVRTKIADPTRLVTPEPVYTTSALSSSPLSSPPSSMATTPEGLLESSTQNKRKPNPTGLALGSEANRSTTTLNVGYEKFIPAQQTGLKRKAGSDEDFVGGDDILAALASKRVKDSVSTQDSGIKKSRRVLDKHTRKVRFTDPIAPGRAESALGLLANTALSDPQLSPRRALAKETNMPIEHVPSSQVSNEAPTPKGKPDRKPRPKRKTKDQLALEIDVTRHGEWVETYFFPHEDKINPVFYAADGITQYVESAEGSPAKNGKAAANTGGGIKKRKGGGGWNKGLGKGKGKGKGRGRGRGNRREEEEEDPFEGKDSASDDHKNLVKVLKARQALLRSFFRDVGRQQADILDTLSLRDINRLARRANAHKKVPEYDEVLEDLTEMKEDAIDLANRKFELEKKLAEDQFSQKKALLEQQLKQRCEQVRAEHLSGAQGDVMLLQKQAAAIVDEDRTDDGSHNQDSEYFPRYHEYPESTMRNEPVRVRGYTSSKIVDERPFKHQLAASNYDDQVRRDVLQSDVMAPIIRSLEKSNKERREAEAREKTQNMMALSNEAVHQLSEIKGYLVPTRLSSTELNSYSLSLLADISEYHAEKFKDKTYRFLALPPGETFPREALDYEHLPSTRETPRRAHPPPPRFPNIPNPSPRTHQFVFQNPGAPSNTRQPPTTTQPSPQATPTSRVQQRFPVQFVNQTIESRNKAGNGGGKGGQRMLLPKV